VFEPVTKSSVRIEDASEIADAIDRAFILATSGRPGPVHVEIAVSALTSGEIDLPEAAPPTTAPAAAANVAAIAERIDASSKIALVAGKNAFWPEVSDALVSLAEHLQAPVVHVWDSHGAIPTVHPLSLGLWRAGNSNEFVDATFDAADLVLGVGVRRGNDSGVTLAEQLGERFVIVDAVDEPVGDEHLEAPSIAALVETVRAIVQATRERPSDAATLDHCATAQRLFKAGITAEIDRYRDGNPWPISVALESLAGKMTPETIVVSDVSNVKIWAPVQLPTYNSLSHLQSGSWGAMGYVVPGVLGAAIARPDRKVVGIVGDAAFLMGSNDFATICALGLPVVIAVHADQTIGMIYYSLKHAFNRTYKTEVPPVDFVAYAEALGGRGIRVDRPDQIDAAWDEALAANGPVLLEIRAGHDFPRPYPIQRIIDQGREAVEGR
jgi:acetolactate synthase-1/2/3 large subunit